MKLEHQTKTPAGESFEANEVEALPLADDFAERPLPANLRYFMLALLVVSLTGVIAFGYSRQAAVRPSAPLAEDAESCKDPLTENRLRETLKQNPNDFETLMDWGTYNLNCDPNYPVAVAAYQQATFLADQPNTTLKPEERTAAHFRLGLAHLYNENLPGAQSQFERIITENPKNTSAMLALGIALSKREPDKAAPYLKKVIELEPGSEFAKEAQSLLDDIAKKK